MAPGRFGTQVPVLKQELNNIKSSILVRLFRVDTGSIGVTICGDRIGKTGLQACVAQVIKGGESCGILSHKEKAIGVGLLYISCPTSSRKSTVYIEPYLSITTVNPKDLSSFMKAERLVAIWPSLFPRLPSLTSSEITALVTSVDFSLANGGDYLTPNKNKGVKAAEESTMQTLSLPPPPLLYPDSNSSPSLQPLLVCIKICCDQVNIFARASLNCKDSFVVSQNHLHSLQVDLSLIKDHIGTDPGIMDIPLRSTWEVIMFVNGTITDIVSQLPSSSLSLQQELSIKAPISTTLSSFFSSYVRVSS